jgi:hypothetical protein
MIAVVRYKNVAVAIHCNPERIPERACGAFTAGRHKQRRNIERKYSELFLIEKIP